MRARVPNFVKANGKMSNSVDINAAYISGNNLKALREKEQQQSSKRMSLAHLAHPASLSSLHQLHQMHNSNSNYHQNNVDYKSPGYSQNHYHSHHNMMQSQQQQQQYMWHARSYESGIGE